MSLNVHGHVVTSGIGKAGIIAQKISATLASIGVPSFFLHPAEAVHGDMGRFTKLDVALIFSNSGETEEVTRMIPAIKRIGAPIVSITAGKDSTIAKHSDITLWYALPKESGPLSLAPTTSTSVMLAIGDALSMTILREKGLTKEEFAFFHPGGALGRALLTVREVMRVNDEVLIVPESTLVKDVLHKISLTKGRPGAALIINSSGILSGIFTDGDLRRCLESGTSFLEKPVYDVMGKSPKTISADKLASEATKILLDNKIDQLGIIDESGCPIGLVDIQDVAASNR
jgi:arabinose-5-phosphate isomerase